MRFLSLSWCILGLLGGDATRLPLYIGGIHQFAVPSGTVIIVIECIEEASQLLFTNCMTGPPFHCIPRRPSKAFSPMDPADKIDPTVRWPGTYWSLAERDPYYPPDGTVYRASLDEMDSYVCREYAYGCHYFDEDHDRDIDLLDWAERTVRFSHEDRIRKNMGPMRATP
jgi:hypothetical protein